MRLCKMDMLDRLVSLAQISGSADVQCLFQGGWYVRHEVRRGRALVHIVTGGTGWLKADAEAQPRRLHEGDVVFFPRGAAHVLSSEEGCANSGAAVETAEDGAFLRKKSGEGAADLSLFCARFSYDTQADLMAGLPETVVLNICLPCCRPRPTMPRPARARRWTRSPPCSWCSFCASSSRKNASARCPRA